MSIEKKAWLITWNKDNWPWDDYEEGCEQTKQGQLYKKSWNCISKKPRIGDGVYLIKLGEKPKGLIGHGTVSGESYEAEHYDPDKAAEGKLANYIDITFDRLIDYQLDGIVSQDDLNKKCSAQEWSPIASGIEIKPEVLPELRKMWAAITAGDDGWWPSLSEFDPGISADEYMELFLDESIVKRTWLNALFELYQMPDHLGTCKQLGNRYDYAPSHYISYFSSAAVNIAKKTGCLVPNKNEKLKYWPILFQGKNVTDKSEGNYCWRMRKRVQRAIEMLADMGVFANEAVHYSPNMILYGPPGTGKTYHSVIYAVAICDGKKLQEVKAQPYDETLKRFNELKDQGRIAFTTFHQSYGYEEFIEGIRPVMINDESTGNLQYEIKDGIFKQLCNAARTPDGVEIDHNTAIWFVTLKSGKANDLKAECFRDGEIRFEGEEDLKADDAWMYDRLTWMCKGDYVLSYGGGGDLIDGIGILQDDEPFYDKSRSSFRWIRKVKWILTGKTIRVTEINNGRLLPRFEIAKMNHMRLSDLLHTVEENGGQRFRENDKPYVLIVDEINRGNISKIFGELITLIEASKRAGASEEMEAILPYSGESFSVPQNVYILGTMNTADRSIAIMDTALRRRFEFAEMMPETEVFNELGIGVIDIAEGGELNLIAMLNAINRRIEVLYDREHMIGHAFFTKLYQGVSIEEVANVFEKQVIPLLQEYFYEDYEKIQLVLGDNAKEDEFKFILDTPVSANVFKGDSDFDLVQDKTYTIQHEAFLKLGSYLQIYE